MVPESTTLISTYTIQEVSSGFLVLLHSLQILLLYILLSFCCLSLLSVGVGTKIDTMQRNVKFLKLVGLFLPF